MSKTTIPSGGIGADIIDATKIADDAISEEHLDATAITGLTALGAEPADKSNCFSGYVISAGCCVSISTGWGVRCIWNEGIALGIGIVKSGLLSFIEGITDLSGGETEGTSGCTSGISKVFISVYVWAIAPGSGGLETISGIVCNCNESLGKPEGGWVKYGGCVSKSGNGSRKTLDSGGYTITRARSAGKIDWKSGMVKFKSFLLLSVS